MVFSRRDHSCSPSTPPGPRRFDSYISRSATFKMFSRPEESGRQAAYPMLAVNVIALPFPVSIRTSEIPAAIRPAMVVAATRSVSGRITANSSPPYRDVAFPQVRAEPPRRHQEDPVPHHMPVGIVDPLEAVQVEHDDGKRTPVPRCPFQLDLDFFMECSVVVQQGEGVLLGKRLDEVEQVGVLDGDRQVG